MPLMILTSVNKKQKWNSQADFFLALKCKSLKQKNRATHSVGINMARIYEILVDFRDILNSLMSTKGLVGQYGLYIEGLRRSFSIITVHDRRADVFSWTLVSGILSNIFISSRIWGLIFFWHWNVNHWNSRIMPHVL